MKTEILKPEEIKQLEKWFKKPIDLKDAEKYICQCGELKDKDVKVCFICWSDPWFGAGS